MTDDIDTLDDDFDEDEAEECGDGETDEAAARRALEAYEKLTGPVSADDFIRIYTAMRDAMWWDDDAVAEWCDVTPRTAGAWYDRAPRPDARDDHLSMLQLRIQYELGDV